MEHYYPYDPSSTTVVEDEVQTVINGAIQLRHIPKQGSIQIAGFVESSSPRDLETNEFYCQYSLNTMSRECNRIIYFHESVSGQTVHVTYITVGTVFTADDANEIKRHLDMPHTFNVPTATRTTKGIVRVGEGLEMQGDGILTCTVKGGGLESLPTANHTLKGGVKIGNGLAMIAESLTAEPYELPTASESIKGGVMIGAGLSMTGDSLNVTIQGDNAFFNDVEPLGANNVSDYNYGASPAYYDENDPNDAFVAKFVELNGRQPQLGDIQLYENRAGTHEYYYFTTGAGRHKTGGGSWKPLGNYWNTINPFLTVTDREKLDSLENYTLAPATNSSLGGVMIGTGLSIDSAGKLDVTVKDFSLPTASSSIKGGVKVGDGLGMSGETLNVTLQTATTSTNGLMSSADKTKLNGLENYTLQTASSTVKGGVKVGSGLGMTNETLNVTIQPATSLASGLMSSTDKIKLDGLENYTLPAASESIKGGVKVGTGLVMDGDTLNVSIETGSEPFFPKNEFVYATVLNYSDRTWSPDNLDGTYSPEKIFREQTGRPSELGDIVQWMDTGNQGGYAYRTATQWVNMDYTLNPTQGVYWANMCPFLTVEDRNKLDNLDTGASAPAYTLPTASSTVKGGVMIGSGLGMSGETLNVTLQTATTSANGLMSAADKTKLNDLERYTLPTAGSTIKGGVKIGAGLEMDGDTLNCTVGSSFLLNTVSSTVEGFMWISTT